MPIENQIDSSAAADHLISYPRSFVTTTGNVTSAILLSQLLRLSQSATETDGWVSKTLVEWQELTGMGRSEQSAARKSLLKIDLMEESVRGMPATLCFRLKHDELARLLPEANQYAENENLVSNLVCSPEWVGADAEKSSANQFSEGSKPLEDKACEAMIHPQTEVEETNRRIFEGRVRDAFNWLGGSIGKVKNQSELLNIQGAVNKKLLDQMKLMLIGLLVMVSLILILSITIWMSLSDYQSHASPQKPMSPPMSNAQQYRR